LLRTGEIVQVPEEGEQPRELPDRQEDGVEVPIDQLQPETLRNVVGEFVTREWEELGDANRYTLDDKIDQVLRQLNNGQAKLVYDQVTMTCNIVPTR
jgi:uncharacterized protein YheU (UPF0270 family)